jgi:tape measure domain-containing protein
MAIQQLGINMFIRGAEKVARDISHVAVSVFSYSKMMNMAEKQMVRMGKAGVSQAEQAFLRQERAVVRATKAFKDQQTVVFNLEKAYNAMAATITNKSATEKAAAQLFTRIKLEEANLKKLVETSNKLKFGSAAWTQRNTDIFMQQGKIASMYAELKKLRQELLNVATATANVQQAGQDLRREMDEEVRLGKILRTEKEILAEKAEDLRKKQESLNQIMNQGTGFLAGMAKILSVASGGYGKNIVGASRLDTALLKMGMQVSAISVLLNLATLAIDAVAIALKLLLGAVKLIASAFLGLLGIAVNLVKVIGGGLLKGLKAIISLPFNIAVKGLTAFWESLKRIGEIAIGMNLSNLIWHLGTQIKNIGEQAFNAAADFQQLQIRLTGLVARDMSRASEGTLSIADAMDAASVEAQQLSYWISKLAVQSPFSATEIAKTLSLAMSYDFTEKEAQSLTESILNFATGMGLGNEEMVRIIENFGQMKAQGKITGTELRDLARGAFLPINRVLEIMGQNLGLDSEKIGALRKELQDMTTEGDISINEFFKAFEQMSGEDFPNAISRMSSTWNTAKSNINDFIETVIGWRVLTPIVAKLGSRLQAFVSNLMTPEAITMFERIGNIGGRVLDFFFRLSDSLTGSVQTRILKITTGFNTMFTSLKKIVELRGMNMKFPKAMKEMNVQIKNLRDVLASFGLGKAAGKLIDPLVDLADAFINMDTAKMSETVEKIKTSLSSIINILWTDIIVPKAKEIGPKILDAVKTAGGFILTGLVWVWDNIIVEWWNNTGQEKFLGMIRKLGEWITGSDELESVGSAIANGITTGLRSAAESGWIKTAGDLIIAGLSGAAAAAVNVMSGILASGIASTGSTMGSGENIEPPDWVTNQEGATSMFSPIMDAISELAVTARTALDNALNELVGTITRLRDAANGDYSGYNQLTQFFLLMDDIGFQVDFIMFSIGTSLDRIEKSAASLGITLSLHSGAFTGFTNFMDFLTRVLVTGPLFVIAEGLNAIAKALESISSFKDGGILRDLFNEQKSLKDETKKIEGGMSTWEKISGMDDSVLEDIKTRIGSFITKVGEFFTPVKEESTTTTSAIIEDWKKVADEVVLSSIVPEMMEAIIALFTEKYAEILSLTEADFVNPFTSMFDEMNLFSAGNKIMMSLWAGMKSNATAMLAWLADIKAQIAELGSGVGGSNPGVPNSSKTVKLRGIGKDAVNVKKGGSFVVPQGYPNDTFPVNLTSGELVTVIPNASRSLGKSSFRMPNQFMVSTSINNGGQNNTTTIEKHYHLNVNSTRMEESLSTEFGIMRLLGE